MKFLKYLKKKSILLKRNRELNIENNKLKLTLKALNSTEQIFPFSSYNDLEDIQKRKRLLLSDSTERLSNIFTNYQARYSLYVYMRWATRNMPPIEAKNFIVGFFFELGAEVHQISEMEAKFLKSINY